MPIFILVFSLMVSPAFSEEIEPSSVYSVLDNLPQTDEVSSAEDVEGFMQALISGDVSLTGEIEEEREILPEHNFSIEVRLINKRLGRVQNVTLSPDKAERIDDLVLLGRGCAEERGAAFVNALQITSGESLFSGWLYKNTPSVTGLSHPVYELKLKSCNVL